MALKVRKRIKNGLTMIALGAVAGTGVFIALKYHDAHREPTVQEVLEEAREKAESAIENPIEEVVTETVTIRQETLEQLFSPASELVSYKYFYTSAADMEKFKEIFGRKIPGTTDKTVFTYDGTISAGIDLSKLSYDVIDNDARTIVITMPAPEILSHELDTSSFSYYNMTNSIFTHVTPEELTGKIDELKQREERKLWKNEDFFRSVSDNAKNVLTDILTMNSDTQDFKVTFNVTDPEPPEEVPLGVAVDGMIAMPLSAADYRNYTYPEVINMLTDMGFTNIDEPEAIKDLYAGLLINDGQVETVTINGNSYFSAETSFPVDASVHITYHTFVEQNWTLPPSLKPPGQQ